MGRFTTKQREEILERDGYRCVLCGNGNREGYDLYVEPLLPNMQPPFKLDDGCTVCSRHHHRRKGSSLLEAWGEMMTQMASTPISPGNREFVAFASEMRAIKLPATNFKHANKKH